MSLHLSQVRTTYSSPSTLFWGIYLDVNYAHRFMKFHRRAKKNCIYSLSITHLKRDVKKFNVIAQGYLVLGFFVQFWTPQAR